MGWPSISIWRRLRTIPRSPGDRRTFSLLARWGARDGALCNLVRRRRMLRALEIDCRVPPSPSRESDANRRKRRTIDQYSAIRTSAVRSRRNVPQLGADDRLPFGSRVPLDRRTCCSTDTAGIANTTRQNHRLNRSRRRNPNEGIINLVGSVNRVLQNRRREHQLAGQECEG